MVRIYLTCTVLFLCGSLLGQYHEVGLGLGVAGYYGDLSPKNTMRIASQWNVSSGLFYTFNLSPHFAARVNASYATISGTDQHYTNPTDVKARNLSFRSRIIETGLMFQVNLLPFVVSEKKRPYTFFLQGGIAGFHFNPKAKYQGKWYALQPLGTEGQGIIPEKKLYSKYALGFPFGIGAKFTMTPRILFGIEINLIPTRTDYLDDVSTTYVSPILLEQTHGEMAKNLSNRTMDLSGNTIDRTGTNRGNAGSKDWYSVGMLVVSYRFISEKPSKESSYLFDKWL